MCDVVCGACVVCVCVCCVCVCVVCVYICVCVCVVCVYICVCGMCVHLCVCVCVCGMCVHLCVCIVWWCARVEFIVPYVRMCDVYHVVQQKLTHLSRYSASKGVCLLQTGHLRRLSALMAKLE